MATSSGLSPMPVDFVPCWFTAGEWGMADTALTTAPPGKYHQLQCIFGKTTRGSLMQWADGALGFIFHL